MKINEARFVCRIISLAAKAMRTERACSLQTMKMMQARDPMLYQDLEAENEAATWYFFQIRPSGWWDQDRRHFSLGVQKRIDGIDVARGTISPSRFDPEHDTPRTIWRTIYTPITMIVGPNLEYAGAKIAKAETHRRLARLACRLEEYRLAHGNQYPDKLDELPDLPAHLNQEVLSEEPLRYQRKGDGYLLYSIGWNQKDDGGVRATDDREGDWVWPSP